MTAAIEPKTTVRFDRTAAELENNGWRRLELGVGESLWRRGEEASSLAWVERGALRVEVEGVERGTVGAGELVGEASAFVPRELRTADVVAAASTTLWVLRGDQIVHLRGNNVTLYDTILRAAVATIARRIGENDREVSQRRRTDHRLPEWTPPTLWARVRRSFERADDQPPIADALAALPSFRAKGLLASDIADIAEPVWLRTSEALCLEGDPATSMYIVARGALAVMLSAGEQSIEIARIGPGSLLGTAALLHETKRTASLIAAEPTWVYELTRERVDTLSIGAWRMLVESLLVAMREQLVRAHQR